MVRDSRGKKCMPRTNIAGSLVVLERGVRVRRNYNIFNLVMENVLKGLPDKISCPDIIHKCTSNVHILLNHFQIARSWRLNRFPVYIKTMRSCSSMFDTSSQSFQRKDDQEVDAHLFMFLSSPKQTKCTLENDVILHCFR
jgi:hypothetical protein